MGQPGRAGIATVALAAAFVVSSRTALALDPSRAITQYVHDVWRAPQPLPDDGITSILQTRDGYLWLGTLKGVARFDGSRAVSFDTRNTPELGHNHVTSLVEDRAGRLWIGTYGGGLTCRDGTRFLRYTAKEGLPHEIVMTLFEDRRGRLWVGTRGGGFARVQDGRLVREPGTEAASGSRVRTFLEDRDGALWIGTENGLFRLKDGVLTLLTRQDGLTHDRVLALAEDEQGLWVGTEGGGLNRLVDGRWTAITTRQGLTSDNVWCLRRDRDGNLWIGTDGGGLARWSAGRLTSFTSKDGLTADYVWAIREDREGSLWIATNGGGLNRLKDGYLTALTTREGLSSDFIRAIRRTRDGSLWVGTYEKGLNRLREGKVTVIASSRGLSNDSVTSLLEARDGGLWIGTRAGLNRWEDDWVAAVASANLSRDFIYALHEDEAGALWIGTNGSGLKRLKDGQVTALTTRDGLSNDVVTTLLGGRDGSLWIGTYGGGLNRLKDGSFETYTTTNGLTSNSVSSLFEDEEGAVWIGTGGGGLNRLRDGRLAAVTTSQGLFDDDIVIALQDQAGGVWAASNRGIFRVARHELEEVMDGKRPRVDAVGYGLADGMRSLESNAGGSAGFRDRDGRLWFSTRGGAVFVDPARPAVDPGPPPVLVEDVLADGRALDGSTGFRLPAGTNRLEVRFTALSFRDPSRLRFRFRLDGFDRDWVEAGSRRTADYTNLPHGRYQFRVDAANGDRAWSGEGATLALEVEPRVRERLWFRLLGLAILAAALYGGHRLRVWRLQARQRELVVLVDERTASLRLANEQLERLASLDGLTHIANRRAFDETLRKAWADHRRRRSPLSVVLCDIDHFKRYNDTHGHQAGDQALVGVAQALANALRRETDLVARYGGEELALLLPDTDAIGAERIAQTALEAVRGLVLPHRGSVSAPHVTISVGGASIVPDLEVGFEDLVARADRALYHAKEAGRNRAVVAIG